jgi:hypothetical protein
VCGSRSHTKHAVNTYRLRTSIRNIYNSAHDVGIAVANAAISLWYKCVYGLFIEQLMSRKPLCPSKETNAPQDHFYQPQSLICDTEPCASSWRKKCTIPVPQVAINCFGVCTQIVQVSDSSTRKVGRQT